MINIALPGIIPTSTQLSIVRSTGWDVLLDIFLAGQKKCWWWEHFPIHEIGRIDGGRGFRTGRNMFRIGGNTFYNQINEIPMKILEFKRSGIGLITEFRGIPNGFPNQADVVVMHHCQNKGALWGAYTLSPPPQNYIRYLRWLLPIHCKRRRRAQGLMWGARGPVPLAAAMVVADVTPIVFCAEATENAIIILNFVVCKQCLYTINYTL